MTSEDFSRYLRDKMSGYHLPPTVVTTMLDYIRNAELDAMQEYRDGQISRLVYANAQEIAQEWRDLLLS